MSDICAGWIDARRTPGARVVTGVRVGGLDYAAGYAAAIVVRMVTRGRY